MIVNHDLRTLLGLIPLLAMFNTRIDNRADKVEKNFLHGRKNWEKEYDYIIVGGGTAGSVLARRLSDETKLRILLIEAGGMENIMHEIPLAWPTLRKSEFDWNFLTQAQEVSCFGLTEKRVPLPRGKVLGGSSSMSNLIYVRGNRMDYDTWLKDGAIGWSWDEVFPYFLKSEDNADQEIAFNGYHRRGGLLGIERSPFTSDLSKIWLEAGKYLGYSFNDCNSQKQSGFSIPQGFIKKGVRSSAYKAFLEPVAERANLHIMLDARVMRILFGDDKRAVGVEFERDSLNFVVYAKSEVILTAGAINSPHLLMLSGVGPADHLYALRIPLVADLPVGDNLHDHPYVSGMTFSVEQSNTFRLDKIFSPQNFLRYLVSGSGPLTSFGGIEGLAFMSTRYGNTSIDWPDIELLMVNGDIQDNFNYLDQEMRGLLNFTRNMNTFSILPVILRPKSRGSVRLKSADFKDAPLIDPLYLTHPDDIMVMVEAMKAAVAIGTAIPFQDTGAKLIPYVIPSCDHYDYLSDQYFACWARMMTNTIHDPVGTCKMGPPWDKSSVVDSQLRVLGGITGLRVADASIMPRIISGHTNAATIMIAEKAADMIIGRQLEPFAGPIPADYTELKTRRREPLMESESDDKFVAYPTLESDAM
ncbi:glucose dehydrogenase [FAD, quinone]-like [Brevipalpus obovatus]|uniref:glucose dehydrogenase [FAD, quinone]-like n=1 Tax=Brevipalpus obovatus TaxID=246614 RepID=UPI003D9EA314